MFGGTLVALAADEIVMDADAVLGPVDPQLGSQQGGYYPAPNRDDQTLILGEMARRALRQVHETVRALLLEHQTPEKADEIARMLSEGRWTHDYPINFDQAREMGLPVSDQMPVEICAIVDLYPQARQRRPGRSDWVLHVDQVCDLRRPGSVNRGVVRCSASGSPPPSAGS